MSSGTAMKLFYTFPISGNVSQKMFEMLQGLEMTKQSAIRLKCKNSFCLALYLAVNVLVYIYNYIYIALSHNNDRLLVNNEKKILSYT